MGKSCHEGTSQRPVSSSSCVESRGCPAFAGCPEPWAVRGLSPPTNPSWRGAVASTRHVDSFHGFIRPLRGISRPYRRQRGLPRCASHLRFRRSRHPLRLPEGGPTRRPVSMSVRWGSSVRSESTSPASVGFSTSKSGRLWCVGPSRGPSRSVGPCGASCRTPTLHDPCHIVFTREPLFLRGDWDRFCPRKTLVLHTRHRHPLPSACVNGIRSRNRLPNSEGGNQKQPSWSERGKEVPCFALLLCSSPLRSRSCG